MSELNAGAVAFSRAPMAGSTRSRAQASRGNNGRHARPPASTRYPDPRPGKARRPLGGSTFSAASSSGCIQPLIERSLAADVVADPLPAAQIRGISARLIEQARCRGHGEPHRTPTTAAPVLRDSSCQRCPVANRRTGNLRALRPTKAALGCRSSARKPPRGYAGQQQMVAIGRW